MRTLLILFLFSSVSFASGPKYFQKDPILQDELENVYKDIDNLLNGDVRISSVTIGTAIISTETVRYITISTMTASSATITSLSVGTLSTSGTLGKIKQVVTANTTTRTSSTSTSFANTSLTASITPAATSSKILVLWTGSMAAAGGTANSADIFMTVDRGGNNIGDSSAGLIHMLNATATVNLAVGASGAIYDSPNTASSVTYTIQIKTSSALVTVQWLSGLELGQIILMEVGV